MEKTTLTQHIKNEPYFKVTNCTDLADVQYALDRCSELEKRYGQSKVLDAIWGRLLNKKDKLK